MKILISLFLILITTSCSQNKKEAAKYYNSGKFDADHQFAKKKMPDDLYDKKFMDSAPAHILIGYRMFEQTFVKRLNKFYKVKF